MPGLARFAKKPPSSSTAAADSAGTNSVTTQPAGASSTSSREEHSSSQRVSFADGTKQGDDPTVPRKEPLLSEFSFSEEPRVDDQFMTGLQGFLPVDDPDNGSTPESDSPVSRSNCKTT